jgi:hypothetical protein
MRSRCPSSTLWWEKERRGYSMNQRVKESEAGATYRNSRSHIRLGTGRHRRWRTPPQRSPGPAGQEQAREPSAQFTHNLVSGRNACHLSLNVLPCHSEVMTTSSPTGERLGSCVPARAIGLVNDRALVLVVCGFRCARFLVDCIRSRRGVVCGRS